MIDNIEAIQAATLRLMRDDGAAVYINGVEVARDNLRPGAASHINADRAVAGLEETEFFPFDIDPGVLNEGVNHIAVEIHQSNPSSSDIGFDLQLKTLSQANEPGVLANDEDADADPLTARLLEPPTHGELLFFDDGFFRYTPNADFTGVDQFEYFADDGIAGSNRAIVTIQISAAAQDSAPARAAARDVAFTDPSLTARERPRRPLNFARRRSSRALQHGVPVLQGNRTAQAEIPFAGLRYRTRRNGN